MQQITAIKRRIFIFFLKKRDIEIQREGEQADIVPDTCDEEEEAR